MRNFTSIETSPNISIVAKNVNELNTSQKKNSRFKKILAIQAILVTSKIQKFRQDKSTEIKKEIPNKQQNNAEITTY